MLNVGVVADGATVSAVASNSLAKEGESVILSCYADGNPAPSIVWYKLSTHNKASIYTSADWHCKYKLDYTVYTCLQHAHKYL
jgi:hypothetical protein